MAVEGEKKRGGLRFRAQKRGGGVPFGGKKERQRLVTPKAARKKEAGVAT